MNKLFKYRLLRHFPGNLGRRYQDKLMRLRARTIEFEEAIRRSEGLTCIDLGANVGIYTRKMALGTKQVIAFEPDPWAHTELQANIADLDNIKIENAAAGTSECETLLYRHVRFRDDPNSHSQSSSVIASKRNVIEEGAIEVRQLDFIDYLQGLEEEIGILKIDIEGAEVDLLEALFERPDILLRINYIFAETHEKQIPSLGPRVKSLREKAEGIERPHINLYWS